MDQKILQGVLYFAFFVVLLTVLLYVLKSCAVTSFLSENTTYQEKMMTETVKTRAEILKTFDHDCLIYMCANECLQQYVAKSDSEREICNSECIVADDVVNYSSEYPQCRYADKKNMHNLDNT